MPPTFVDDREDRIRAIAREVFQEMMTAVPAAISPVLEAGMFRPPVPGIPPGGVLVLSLERGCARSGQRGGSVSGRVLRYPHRG